MWVTSGWLWWVWLSHDVANIAVYLPRQLSPTLSDYGNGLFYNTTILYFLYSWWTYSKGSFR